MAKSYITHVDTMNASLRCASAILNLLMGSEDRAEIRDGTITEAAYAALQELDRAQEALKALCETQRQTKGDHAP